jgi:branched-chain amino acid transport system substrate-binding protein
MNRVYKFLLVSFLSAFFLASCSSSDSSKAEKHFNSETVQEITTVKGKHYVAIAAPLTGPYSDLGKTLLEGAQLAIEEYNANPKNKANPVGFILIDDGGIVIEALERAKIAIAEGVLGVIGHVNSGISIEASKKYMQAKIPQISPASTHPKYTERPEFRGYVFRTIGTDRQIGEAAADLVLGNGKYKKIAVLFNDRPYGVSVSSEFIRRLAHHKEKEIVFYETIPVRTHDHSITAKKVAKTGADLVFFVGEYNDAGYLVKNLKKELPKAQFLSAEGAHNQSFIDIAGSASEGAMILGAPLPSKAVVKKYKKRFKKNISGYVATSYNATKILLGAMEANNFEDTEAIARSVASNPVFDLNGDLLDPSFTLYKVSKGVFTVVK